MIHFKGINHVFNKKRKKSITDLPKIETILKKQLHIILFPQWMRPTVEMSSSTWYEATWQVGEAMWVVHWGGTWQTENLQLQWHSLAAQVIADISNVWSAKQSVNKPVKVLSIYKRTQSVCQVSFPQPPQQSKYINSTAQRACWCSFTFLIKLNPDIITIMPFLLQLYIIVWYKFRVQKSTKVWHAKCLITRLPCEQTLKFYFSSF